MTRRKDIAETNTIEHQWICRNKEFPPPVRCPLDLSRVTNRSSAHFGQRGGAPSFPAKI